MKRNRHLRLTCLAQLHLLNRGSIQDLNSWIGEVGGWELGDADDEEKNQMEKQYWGSSSHSQGVVNIRRRHHSVCREVERPHQITTRAWPGRGSGWESVLTARQCGEVERPLEASLYPVGGSISLGSRTGDRALELRTQLHMAVLAADEQYKANVKICV
ncbi:hypothetical protein EYF80_019613 [Liparis tanakae]|uniref:Uncharacterized protein n=1 Tax=Liparis tanakae TaxID=230148 RepID=A0A4Z2HYQ8_9TELE|nr:hypothetical protein EYF80_019613 [Liparis tanakae]